VGMGTRRVASLASPRAIVHLIVEFGGQDKGSLHPRRRRYHETTSCNFHQGTPPNTLPRVEGLTQQGKQWTEEKFQALVEKNIPLKRKDKEFTQLVLQIIDLLPGRDRTSIIRRIIALHGDHHTQSEWTPKDDEKLRKLVAKHGNKWTKIGDILGRDAAAVRLRHKDYISLGENRGLGKWEIVTEDELFRIVVSLLRESDWEVDEGFDVDVVSRYVDWGAVSSSLGTRSRLQCREKWKSWERREDFDFEGKMEDV
jgi:Myb-like DNA-binding domain